MKLWLYVRKNVKITLIDGQVVSGFVEDFCDAADNAEEKDSLLVDVEGSPREYFEDEILSISLTQRLVQSRRFSYAQKQEGTMNKRIKKKRELENSLRIAGVPQSFCLTRITNFGISLIRWRKSILKT